MSWWLVRFYLCTAILNFVFAMPQKHANQKYNFIAHKKNTPNIRRNIEKSVEPPKCTKYETKNTSGENRNTDKSDMEKRALAAGDSFSPNEMLLIAEKLFKKVSDPGTGTGFVSSTFSPQELADKLFEAFFFTKKRIIFLNDEDLPGIDALQALALSGEPADAEQGVEVTEPSETTYLRSRIMEKMKPKRCKYILVSKRANNITLCANSSGKPSRRRVNLAKYLNKKRHLIINQQRRNREKRMENISEGNSGLTKKQNCRWKYGCSNIVDLDTCQIHSQCANDQNNTNDEFPIKAEINEEALAYLRLRKMLRRFYVDEEVEKILESRNLQLRPPQSDTAEMKRVESLAEYFNKIMEENIGMTNPMTITKSIVGKHFTKEENR